MKLPELAALGATATATLASGPLVRARLVKRQLLDVPTHRSSHTEPTPRGGGLACAAGAAVGALTSHRYRHPVSRDWMAASATLGAVGRLDDLGGLSIAPRLGSQVLVGAAVGSRTGGGRGAIIGAVTVPVIVNAFNFMDGINGISGATAAVWGCALASNRSSNNIIRAQASLTAGMGFGFLPHNVPDATMFLGDVGSYLLGSGIAVTVLQSAFDQGNFQVGNAREAVVPLLPYLADTGTTIIGRALRKEPITEAHRAHAYQQLVHETGWPHWAVAAVVAFAALACAVAGKRRYALITLPSILALYLGSPRITSQIKAAQKRSSPNGTLKPGKPRF